jgi:hypothetical protein
LISESTFGYQKIMSSKFEQLPTDLVKLLLVHLSFEEIYRFVKLSSKYHKLSDDEHLWRLYAESRHEPSNMKKMAIYNYLGHFEYSGFGGEEEDSGFSWLTYMSPLKKSIRHIRSSYVDYLGEKTGQKIFFKKEVIIEYPYRGRPEKLPKDFVDNSGRRKNKLFTPNKKFVLKPNTCVGSTLLHVLLEVYKHMYDLKDDELGKNITDFGISWTKEERRHLGELYDFDHGRGNGYSTFIGVGHKYE